MFAVLPIEFRVIKDQNDDQREPQYFLLPWFHWYMNKALVTLFL
jgi:hypothetical protein